MPRTRKSSQRRRRRPDIIFKQSHHHHDQQQSSSTSTMYVWPLYTTFIHTCHTHMCWSPFVSLAFFFSFFTIFISFCATVDSPTLFHFGHRLSDCVRAQIHFGLSATMLTTTTRTMPMICRTRKRKRRRMNEREKLIFCVCRNESRRDGHHERQQQQQHKKRSNRNGQVAKSKW